MSAAEVRGWRHGDNAAGAGRGALALGGLAIVVAGMYAVGLVATSGEPLLVAPLVVALVGVAVFAQPVVGLYLLFGAALLFEQFEITGLAPLTAQTHFFENLTTFSPVPLRLSLSDLLVLTTCASWAARRLVGTNAPMRAGPFGWAIAAYGFAFILGAVIGAGRGGAWDPIIALAEARGAIYVCILYFLTANIVHERKQLVVLLWEYVLIVGVKALQGIGNYIEMSNGPYGLEAVTAHEDVVFFGAAVALALIMAALRVRARLFYALLALLPVTIVTELLTQRRAGFAALAVVLLLVALMSAVERLRATLLVLGIAVVLSTVYAAAFWSSSSRLAEPLRIVRGVLDPGAVSWRDQSSDAWREIENSNIAFTVQELPLTGVGLGQQYLFQQEPPPLTTFVYWRYIAHNAVLWVWLKAGPYGAFAFWFLVGQVVIRGLRLYRQLGDPFLRAAASFPVLLIATQVVFSSVDLGLTYNRTMTALGIALGLAAPLSAWLISERATARRSPHVAEIDTLSDIRISRPLVGDTSRHLLNR